MERCGQRREAVQGMWQWRGGRCGSLDDEMCSIEIPPKSVGGLDAAE